VRVSFVEAACLVAIGVAMVELHDGNRLRRPGVQSPAALAAAAKPAVAGPARAPDALNLAPSESSR